MGQFSGSQSFQSHVKIPRRISAIVHYERNFKIVSKNYEAFFLPSKFDQNLIIQIHETFTQITVCSNSNQTHYLLLVG